MKGLSWRVYNASTQRIAEIVGAYPVTIQAADLPQALSTGLINAFMTSSATGYDSKAWEHMCYFYPMSNVAEIAPCPFRVPFRLWAAHLRCQFWADCITNISERRFPTGTG